MKKINENFKIENKKPPIFILFLLIFMIIVLCLFYNLGLRFEPVTTIQYEGYAVSGKELVENLLKTDLNAEKYIEAIKIEEDSAIYKKIATYFVGEDKKVNINLDYPIYINNNIALLNLSENSKLITTDFEIIDGYKNSTLVGGGLYNAEELGRADYNDYLFLKNSDNMLVNSKKIEIQTAANTYVIPENSIINFTENHITYYELVDSIFNYKSIIDIDEESKVLIKTEINTPDFTNGEIETSSQSTEYIYNEFLIKLNIIRKPPVIEPIETQDAEKDKTNKPEKEEDKTDNESDDTTEVKWIKPQVTATEIQANVYTAGTNLNIYDPSGAIKTAIIFEIFKNDKVYMRNQAISSGNINLGVLEPNTEYQIRGIYKYSDEEGKTIQVEFINQKIKTKDVIELQPLSLAFENGQIYSNKIELINLKINSDFKLVSETIAGVKKGEIIIDKKVYDIKSSDFWKILSGQEVTYQTKENLKSNTTYSYEIKFYDIVGNEVKLENSTGQTNTCMKKPEAILEKAKTESNLNVPINVEYKNPDNVQIKNINYKVFSTNNDIVDEGAVTTEQIILKNLELSRAYTIRLYADYDLNDNRGETKDNFLGELTFTTVNIEAFGELYLDLEIFNTTSNSTTLEFEINTTQNRTNSELIQLLQEVEIIASSNENVINKKVLNREEIKNLIEQREGSAILTSLKSNSRYDIEIKAIVGIRKYI